MLINSGCGSLVFHEKVHHFVDQTLIFVNSGKQHYTMPENFDNYSRSKLILSLDSFANILNLIDKSGKLSKQFFQSSFLSINLNEKGFGRAKEAFLELNDYQEKSNVNNSLLISACTRLISFFMELNVNSTTDVKNKHFITRAILYINQHIAENLNVEDICSNVFISKYYFCREFKKQIGLSVMK